MALIAQEPAKKKGKKYDFYRGKLYQAKYFVDTTLPLTMDRIETCMRPGREIVEMPLNAL